MLRIAQLLRSLISTLLTTAAEGVEFQRLAVSSRAEMSAEVLFLRKQLAFYQEHQVHPRKLTDAARFSLVLWSRLFNWREALMIVKPETLIGWHRKGFKLFWRWKSRLGRPRLPENLRQLIVRMVQENPTWGEECGRGSRRILHWARNAQSDYPARSHSTKRVVLQIGYERMGREPRLLAESRRIWQEPHPIRQRAWASAHYSFAYSRGSPMSAA